LEYLDSPDLLDEMVYLEYEDFLAHQDLKEILEKMASKEKLVCLDLKGTRELKETWDLLAVVDHVDREEKLDLSDPPVRKVLLEEWEAEVPRERMEHLE